MRTTRRGSRQPLPQKRDPPATNVSATIQPAIDHLRRHGCGLAPWRAQQSKNPLARPYRRCQADEL